MKEKYINEILESDSLLHKMFNVIWEERQVNAEPERQHPDWEKADAAFNRICDGVSEDFYSDLCTILYCYTETYFIVGFKQGLETFTTLLPLTKQNAESNADELQINALKAALRNLREIDPSKEEFIQQIALKTEGFTVIKKSACDRIIDTINEIIQNYTSENAGE